MKKLLSCLVAASSISFIQPVSADTLLYQLTGSGTATFTVDSNPTPASYEDVPPYVGNFNLGPVSGTVGTGMGDIPDEFSLRYYQAFNDGGLDIVSGMFAADGTFEDDGYLYVFSTGPQLYSGTVEDPTLLTGEFDLVDFVDPSITYHLSVTDLDAPGVPEPAAWTLLISGFGLVGGALRMSRRPVFFAN